MKLLLHVHLQRFVAATSLGVGLVAFSGVALAQETVTPTINADGNSGTSNAGVNPAVDADGPTLIYGDIPGGTVIGPSTEGSVPVSDVVYAPPPGTTGDISATNGDAASLGPGAAEAAPGTVTGGSGTALLGPDGTYSVTEVSPSNVTVGEAGTLAPEPVYEPVSLTEPAPEAVAAPVETTEPVVADTDGDGVADVDEANLYGTDSVVWDTDGDGLSDGEELFATGTDSLVWDTDADGVSDGDEVTSGTDPLDAAGVPGSVQDAATGPEGAAAETASLDSDADRLADADEAAVGTDPTNPDTDGDGYYDGDEMNLGTGPFDPMSFPIV